MTARRLGGCALDVVKRHGGRERRKVMDTDLRYCFEAGRQLDQGRFAERRPEEAKAKRRTKHHSGWDLHNRIARRRGESRSTKDKVIAIDQVRRPRRVIRRSNNRIKVE